MYAVKTPYTADYQRWAVQPRRSRTAAAKYEPPTCDMDTDTSYRSTYLRYTQHQLGGPPEIVRPPPMSSLQQLTLDAPFDGRTNYRDEFTARRTTQHDEQTDTGQNLPPVPDAAASDSTAVGLVFFVGTGPVRAPGL